MHKHDFEAIENDANNNNNNVVHVNVVSDTNNLRNIKADTSRSSSNNNKNNNIASETVRSPLRVALASASEKPAVVISSLATPLLTASLNSPPVASLSLSSNGSVDLSVSAAAATSAAGSHGSSVGGHASIRKRIHHSASEAEQRVSPERHGERFRDGERHGSASPSSSTCNKEMYANLLMQLRNQGVVSNDEHQLQINSNNKLSAAARKEKLKSQLCFQCPVCKKRFQRHIAMNAHFQAEHLGATSKNDKICKLCGYVGSNMGPLRKHLLTKHSIDLETPTACLVEPEHCRSGSSSPLPSSSSEKKSLNLNTKHNFANNNNNNSSPSVSIIRTSVVTTKVEDSITSSSTPERRPSPPANVIVHEAPGYFVKQEIHCNTGDDVIEEVAKDLSIKKIKRPGSPSIDLTKKKRHKTEQERVSPRSVVSSRPNSPTISHGSDLLSASSSSSSSVFGLSQWQCQHCNIIFPDQTLYFLHRGFHSNSSDPWKCNGCAKRCTDMYDFNTHLMSEAHH